QQPALAPQPAAPQQPPARQQRRGAAVERPVAKREVEVPAETSNAPAPKKPSGDSLYDQRINSDSAARKIYEDDPYR
ncbi:MAG: hypothetical protein RL701_1079, partial [Pseudomonadota bacterium]